MSRLSCYLPIVDLALMAPRRLVFTKVENLPIRKLDLDTSDRLRVSLVGESLIRKPSPCFDAQSATPSSNEPTPVGAA